MNIRKIERRHNRREKKIDNPKQWRENRNVTKWRNKKEKIQI